MNQIKIYIYVYTHTCIHTESCFRGTSPETQMFLPNHKRRVSVHKENFLFLNKQSLLCSVPKAPPFAGNARLDSPAGQALHNVSASPLVSFCR